MKWISTTDKLPSGETADDDGYKLVWTRWGHVEVARRDWQQGWKPDHWRTSHGGRLELEDVTHWMPLPEAPSGN